MRADNDGEGPGQRRRHRNPCWLTRRLEVRDHRGRRFVDVVAEAMGYKQLRLVETLPDPPGSAGLTGTDYDDCRS